MDKEENKKDLAIDCSKIIAKYCNNGETIYHVLRINFTDVLQGMEITGLPIIDTLWMLAIAEARFVQKEYEFDMLLSLELCNTDILDKNQKEE